MNENKANPGVSIELAGRSFKLKYTLHSLAQLKKLTGLNPMSGELDPTDPELIVALIWAGLIQDQRSFDGSITKGQPDKNISEKLAEIGRQIDFKKLRVISEAITEAFKEAGGEETSGAEVKNEEVPGL